MAGSSTSLALAPIIGLAAYCLTHIVAARLHRSRNPYPVLAIGAAAGVVVTEAVTLAACQWRGDSAIDVLCFSAMNAVASIGFAFGYFNFVNLTIASLRIRILEEIGGSDGWLSRATLLDRYGTGSVAELRLGRLVEGGHLVERNGRLHSGRLQFLVVARIFDALRRLVFGAAHAAIPPGSRQRISTDDGIPS